MTKGEDRVGLALVIAWAGYTHFIDGIGVIPSLLIGVLMASLMMGFYKTLREDLF